MQQPLKTVKCANFDEYIAWIVPNAGEAAEIAAIEADLVKDDAPFQVHGHCAVCEVDSDFLVDFAYAPPAIDGKQLPNWRERLECQCGLNNRMRAALHFLRGNLAASDTDLVYITEQITPLYHAFERLFPLLIGSEYLSDGTSPGRTNAQHIRHEDVTHLTFPDAHLDIVASFDVLEHVPNYAAAFREFARCLKSGGSLLLSVPFFAHRTTTLTRARMRDNGDIEHLETPEYHGDPLSTAGVLCFYHFGWDLLDVMRSTGFVDANVHFYWSREYGYLGGRQLLIAAQRA